MSTMQPTRLNTYSSACGLTRPNCAVPAYAACRYLARSPVVTPRQAVTSTSPRSSALPFAWTSFG